MRQMIGWSAGGTLAVGINIGIWGYANVPALPSLLIPLGAAFLGFLLGDIADAIRKQQ